MGLDGHMRRGIGCDQAEIGLQLAFGALKLGCGELPDGVMILVGCTPAGLPDACPLFLFRYHVGELVSPAFGHRGLWSDLPDGTLKGTAEPV